MIDIEFDFLQEKVELDRLIKLVQENEAPESAPKPPVAVEDDKTC